MFVPKQVVVLLSKSAAKIQKKSHISILKAYYLCEKRHFLLKNVFFRKIFAKRLDYFEKKP